MSQNAASNKTSRKVDVCNKELNSDSDGEIKNDLSSMSLTEAGIKIPERSLPAYNVPEKIIIVFDRAYDETDTCFEIMAGKQLTPLFMLQHAIKIFLSNKSFMDKRHEYALVFLNESTASWVHDFTSCPNDIIQSLQNVKECGPEDIFSLNTLFDLIQEKVEIEETQSNLLIPPTSIVRVILCYGRSYSIPHLIKTSEIQNLLQSPYFTVDTVMTHERPSAHNHCSTIFKALQGIDTKGFAYSFSVSRNASDLHAAMAKILSHPLQRPHQSQANYKITV